VRGILNKGLDCEYKI